MAIGLVVSVAFIAPGVGKADAPRRVVSLNVCTDQLAMLLSAPGQLFSVSHLAVDPRVSAMANEAHQFVINHARAEEIYLMKPDLVLAGAFTSRATVAMLEDFGVPVETFVPVNGIDDIPSKLIQMGTALGRQAEAAEMAREFEERLDVLRQTVGERPRAALYFANGYTAGDRSLAGQILTAAGFENIAIDAGYSDGGILPLEVLAMAAPEYIVTGQRYPGASRSEAVFDHPLVLDIKARASQTRVTDRDWVCGTPFVLRAIEALSSTRED